MTISTAESRELTNSLRLSLMDHQFYYVIPIVTIVFILCMVWIGLYPGCTATYDFKIYTETIMLSAGIVQFIAVLYQLARIVLLLWNVFLTDKQKISLIKLHVANAILSFLSGISHLITYWFEFGGVCCDQLGCVYHLLHIT